TYVSVSGEIHGSLAAEGCEIKGLVEDSIISTGCEIEEGATVIKSVIMPNTKVCKGAVIQYAIVGEETIVGKNCKIGESQLGKEEGQLGIAVVGGHRTIEDNTVLKAEELI
ncbi:MAG: glucose-1-phosphate adenylyltransferase, partial [Oscillospiraceae bacterium]